MLGFLGVGYYNALQYQALVTSSPINVTLVASSIPVFTLVLGLFFFGVKVKPRAALGVSLSILGVIVVVTRRGGGPWFAFSDEPFNWRSAYGASFALLGLAQLALGQARGKA